MRPSDVGLSAGAGPRRTPDLSAGLLPAPLGRALCGDQADDGELAIGLGREAREARDGSDGLLPGGLALGPGQLARRDRDLSPADLDLNLVRMRGEVVVPGWVGRAAAGGGDDQPPPFPVGDVAEDRLAALSVFAPIVVSTRTFIPIMRPLLRRARPVISGLSHLASVAVPGGIFCPWLPPGVFSNVIAVFQLPIHVGITMMSE